MDARDRGAAPTRPGPTSPRIAALGAAAILVASMLSSCTSQQTPTPGPSGSPAAAATPTVPIATPAPAYADTLRIGWPPQINPAIGWPDAFFGFRDAAGSMVSHQVTLGSIVYSSLYKYDPRGDAVPDLADGPCQPQGDGAVIRCRLIETTFHDGTPLTADDVAYSYELSKRQQEWGFSVGTGSLTEMRVVDARTIDFVLPSVDPTFVTIVLPAIPILSRRAVDAAYATFVADTKGITAAELTKLADAIGEEIARDPPACSPRVEEAAALLERIGVQLYREDFSRTGTFDACTYMQAASDYFRQAATALGATGLDAVAAAYECLTIARRPVGTGPYRLVSEDANWIHLEAWSGYHGGLAATRFLDFVPAAGDGSDVVDGTLDIYQAGAAIGSGANLGAAFRATAASHGVRVATPLEAGYFAIMFNARPGRLFADVNLRKALQLCIDLPRDVDAATGGTGAPVYGPVTPGTWAYDAALPKPARDSAAARRLIEGPGWRPGADGTYAKDGVRLAADIVVRGDAADRVKVADLISLEAHDCGMDLRTYPMSFAAIPTQILDYPHFLPGTKTPFDLYVGGWTFYDDPGNPEMFTSSTITTAKNPDHHSFPNFTGFSDPAVDRLAAAATSTYDQAERAGLYRQMQEELAAQLPYLFLWGNTSYDLVRAVVATVDGPLDLTPPNWAWQPERMVVAAAGP